ncbi:MAG: glutaredoxin family protein [Candidatus Woesebacteria bacterium]|jgi:glutaredoxin
MDITVYSTTTCPYCKMLKSYLEEKGFEYKEKLVDQDDAAREEMVNISGGFMGVPYTVIKKDGQQEKIIGFDKAKVNGVLGIS